VRWPGGDFRRDRKSAVNGIRLSLGTVPTREHLTAGLKIIADILSGSPATTRPRLNWGFHFYARRMSRAPRNRPAIL